MKRVTRRTLTDDKPTPKQKRQLAEVARRSDSKIDYSDIPPLNDKFWTNAVHNPFYRPVKEQVTLRIDADVLEWLRQQGKGYQTRLNSLLRSAMVEQLRGKPKRS